ncbi:MAG: HlyD family efflux transporter periplasmic adaptor subunit [Pirellulaceae bacterium]|nr:HlyD family efflux transporter periplasmic adaptor subunit [Thermoguttaceae bacterium]MDI9442741.1 HlyD family efflux transporter periplasmic adaptor subunit [Planctomycetota bacterium]NLY99659.1 HlyD family efflux transporter periplasmic adaptor subunit [Pirellulaceae bacterium]
MRHVSYFVACWALLAIAASGAWGADEPAKDKVDAAAAEKKTEPEKKAEAEKKAEPEKKAEEAKPAEKPAEVPAKTETKPAEAKPKLDTVKAEMFKIDLVLDGTFVAQTMTPVELKPESWTTFKVVKAVAHGTQVRKGEVLVEFESDKLEEAIADQETARQLAALSLQQAEIGLKLLEATTPIDLAMAERQKKIVQEDLARFLKIDLELSQKSAQYSLKSAEETLENQLEELKQLEKMYKADDLTEETEEIILKRQRNAVDRARFYLELAKNRFDETTNVLLPRETETVKVSAELLKLALERVKSTVPLDLEREKINLQKLKIEQKRDAERFAKLKKDLRLMKLTAPADGIVYYGKCVRGKWTGGSAIADKLEPGASASVGVLMTIVNPRPVAIRASVNQKDLQWLKAGLAGTVTPTVAPDARAAASVTRVESIPGVDGGFAAELRVTLSDEMSAIMPGMDCKVKLVPYLKKRTLTIPAKAMKVDELDDTRHYVQLVQDGGRTVRQAVTVGKKSGEKVEILDGLAAGDKILAEYPKDKD